MNSENKSKSEAISILVDEVLNPVRAKAENKLNELESYIENKIKVLDNSLELEPLIVNIGTVKSSKIKIVHRAFEKVLKAITAIKRKEKNIMLVGAAGGGKTSLCANVAETLNIEFLPMSIGQQTTKSDLLGFIDAHGQYHESIIRKAYENGGLLLLDEFDCGHAGVITILNSLLANGHCSFPDKIVKKHSRFICICACNTYGKGADIEYVGRNRLDAATLDRFIVINVDYDSALEKRLTKNNDILKVINKMRDNVKNFGIKLIISPRASMDIADLIEADFEVEEAFEMALFKGVGKDIKDKVSKDVDLSSINKPKKQIHINTEENKTVENVVEIETQVNCDINDDSVENVVIKEEENEDFPF